MMRISLNCFVLVFSFVVVRNKVYATGVRGGSSQGAGGGVDVIAIPSFDDNNDDIDEEPIFKTWANEEIQYRGLCDMILLENHEFNNNLGMDIHLRTKQTEDGWTYVANAAVRIGNETLEVMGSSEGRSNYWINGVLGEGLEKEDSLFLTTETFRYHIHFRRVNDKQDEFLVDLGDGALIMIKTWNNMVHVDILGGRTEAFASSQGLMGKFKSGEHMARDHASELKDVNSFLAEWRVLLSDSHLFHNSILIPDEDSSSCEKLVTQDDAEAACAFVRQQERDLCVVDVLAANDVNYANALYS